MGDLLRVLAFTAELSDEVQNFDCGDEPHQKELADWLRSDATPALERGTKVWLYVNDEGDIVGYGSLGVTRWKYPDPRSHKVQLVIIPAVAIQKTYWGKPTGPPEERYSSQIMRHLLDEAVAWPGKLPLIGLFVHPDNHAAIKLYERFGFLPFSHTYTDSATGVTYRSFLRPLLHPEEAP